MIDDWRWVIDAMPQLVWVADRSGTILYFNRRSRAFEGVVEDTAGAWVWASAVHRDDAKHSAAAWRSSLESGSPFVVEHRLKTAGGAFRWHISHAELTRWDDGEPVWLGIVTDIHDQKLAEQALRESEARFREVANSTPLPIWIHDEHGRQTFVNDSFVEYFGRDPSEVDGHTWVDLLHPDDRERYLAEFTRCVSEQQPFRAAARVRRRDGTWRWIESWGSPRFSADGRFAGHIGTSADVSERQRAEEVLRLAHRAEARRRRHAEFTADLSARLEEVTTPEAQARLLADSLTDWFADRASVVVPGVDPVGPAVTTTERPASPPAPDDDQARSIISAPIVVGSGEPGQMTVVRDTSSRRPFDDLDLEFLRNLADRVGVSFRAAMLRNQEHLIAIRLQEALLPARRLERSDVDIATRYVTATEALEVGGDWYETFELADGRVGVSIGDVVGHNLEAAAAMGQLRAGALALAARSTQPGRLLSDLDVFAHRYGITDFATAACAFIDPEAGELRYASAGHPSMLLVAPDGTTSWLEEALSPPIGALLVTDRPDAVIPFPHGSTLVAYSDGLIERRNQHADRGRQHLRDLVEAVAEYPVEDMCDQIIEAMARASPYADDVALVCLRLDDGSG